MKNQYVPKTLSEFLGESKTVTLKRKYGERPTVVVGTNAPLRNQVLSYVAESGSVSKMELKKFIVGLKEGGSTPAAANMFLKRNAKYFITESKNGVTHFKLSDLGHRLVRQFVPMQNTNVSESLEDIRSKAAKFLRERKRRMNEASIEDDELNEVPEDLDDDSENLEADEIEADELGKEGPAEDIEFDEDSRFKDQTEEDLEDSEHAEADQFEYEEDDEKITLTYYKDKKVTDEDLEDNEDLEDIDDLESEDNEDVVDDEDLSERPMDEEPREYDFKDKGRPGILGMDESAKVMRAQFVSHKLTGKKSPNLGGKLDKKLHNLLADNQDKDPNELKESFIDDGIMTSEEFEDFVQDLISLDDRTEAAKELKRLFDDHPEMHYETGEIAGKDRYKSGLDMFREYYGNYKRSALESVQDDIQYTKEKRMRDLIENVKNNKEGLNEEEQPSEEDELKDEDLDKLGGDDEDKPEDLEEPVEDEKGTTLDDEEGDVEKIEITEFIITVDNVEEAIDELSELGVTAERVPLEPKEEEEIPAEIEEPEVPEEKPAEEEVKESLSEAEEEKPVEDVDLGSSDELGLGDQGEKAPELEEPTDVEGEETLEPTTEFEDKKIKVPADQWPVLKTWLEKKGVDVKEMFGGDIEMEEVSPEEGTGEVEEPTEEISDTDIDFEGISDEDETKVKEDEDKE